MDDILKKLGQLVKEKEQSPMQTGFQLESDCWDRLAACELSEAEIEQIRQKASQSQEISQALEAFSPFDESFDERLSARLVSQITNQADRRSAKKPERFWNRWFVWMPVTAGALACVLALIMLLPSQPAIDLPRYSFTLSRGVETTRGADKPTEKIPVFTKGTLFEVNLRPKQRVRAQLAVAVYRDTEGQLVKLDLPWQQSSNGAIRFRAVVGQDVQLEEGEHHLVFVVASQGHLPEVDQLRLDNDDHSFQVFRHTIRVVEQLP